jgi:NAD(P)H-dependent flavin oxidoreductase YrpB (nitropropane dioxygenase family)
MVKNAFFEEVEKAAAEGKSGGELFKLMEGRMGAAARDAESGAFVCGQVAGLIKEIRPVKDIINGIVQGADSLLKDLCSN